ncbi:hypothetical protein [Enterobacter roggenkampii]|uniref:hypothetical protein n=1 Tax=Enterobacter roggenkampii TaxID=1812935 RepID=UPI003B844729
MSTITKEFTKEQLQQIIETDHVQCGEASALARIALASLEAEPAIHRWRRVTVEPYGPYPWHYGNFIGFSKPVDWIEDEYFYSAPPAPAPAPAPAKAEPVAWLWSHRKHPSEVSLVRPEDDERAEGAHWSGWSCQALYAAPPAPAAMKDHQIRELVNELRDIAVEYHGTQQLRERIARTIRAAMLQGGENAESRCTIQTAPALDSSPKIAESPSGNSPVIPDGWVILPAEPTQAMMNAWLSEVANWRGHAAGYRAMIAAAPQQEVKP